MQILNASANSQEEARWQGEWHHAFERKHEMWAALVLMLTPLSVAVLSVHHVISRH